MNTVNISCYSLTAADQSLAKGIVDSLSQAGMKLAATSPSVSSAGPAIVLFDSVNDELINLIRRASRHGLVRVLALSTTPSALARGNAWEVLQAGASNAFAWDESRSPAQQVAASFSRWREVDDLLNSPLVRNNLVGESASWKFVLRQIIEVARFSDASILITGESGTGKELVARLIHTLDQRPQKQDLITVDCTTIVPELSGSEFFGHDRGSYTGAVVARDGAFALADKGTVFLDEVGELPPRLQSELLRVVQEHTYKRVGSNQWQETNFRLICATNKDLKEAEQQGDFRRDFYYRIAGWTFKLPPLCERPGDIVLLSEHFIRQLSPQIESPELDEPVREYLTQREYPGNVRELRQVVTRMVNRHVGVGPITVGDIVAEERPVSIAENRNWQDASFEDAIRRALALHAGLKEIGSAATDTAIRLVLEDTGGNLQQAARKLGITDRALQLRRASGAGEKNARGNGKSHGNGQFP